MSDQLTAPPAQEQSAPPATATPPSAVNALIEQFAIASLTQQPQSTLDDLHSQIAATQVAAPVPPVAVKPKATPEPEPPVDGIPAEVPPEIPPEPPLDPPAPPDPKPDNDPPDRIRISGYSEEDQGIIAAAHMLAKSQKIPFREAFARVTGTHQTSQPEPEPQYVAPIIPPQITALEAEVAALETQMDAAGDNEGVLDRSFTDLSKKLARSQAKLEAQRLAHEQSTAVKSEVDDAMFNQDLKGFESRAVEEFPDMRRKDSMLYMTAVALGKQIAADPSHPMYKRLLQADAPLALAEFAAKHCAAEGVPVTRKAGVAPAPPVPKPSPNAVQRPGPAPGSRGSVVQPAMTAQDVAKSAQAAAMNVLMGVGNALAEKPTRPVVFR